MPHIFARFKVWTLSQDGEKKMVIDPADGLIINSLRGQKGVREGSVVWAQADQDYDAETSAAIEVCGITTERL